MTSCDVAKCYADIKSPNHFLFYFKLKNTNMKHFYLLSALLCLAGIGMEAKASLHTNRFLEMKSTATRATSPGASLDIYADKLSYGENDKEAKLDIFKGEDVAVVYYRVVNDRGENEVGVTREEGNEITVPLKTHGAYTVIAAAYDEYEDLANPLEYTECYFYYEPDDKENWIPMGTGSMTDDFVASVFSDLAPLTFPVEIERNKQREGQIRVVNPYGETYCKALKEAGVPSQAYSADKSHNHYLYFDISDPEFVYMSEGCTGLRLLNHDVLLIGSFGKYFLDMGRSKNEICFAQYNGTLGDNTITFYQYGLYTMWNPDFEISSANSNEAFSLVLPDASGVEGIVSDEDGEVKYYNMQGVQVSEPLRGVPCIKVAGGKTSKILIK